MGAVLPILLLLHLAASRTDTGIRPLTQNLDPQRHAPGAAGRAAAPLPPGLGGGDQDARAGFLFQPWLDAYLSPWAGTGISEALVRAAHKKARVCWGGLGPEGALRATVVSGALWAVLDPPGPGGYYAAQLGPGWASGKGRIPYALLSIVDALREVPPGGWVEGWGSAAGGR
jgi:protein glucosyltransferase